MLTLVDFYGGTLLIFALAMFEMGVIFWLYGIENFCWDLEYMTGRKASLYWRICWTVFTPLFMIFIFFYSMAEFKPLRYSGMYYPAGLSALGWGIFGFGFAMFPALALVELWRSLRANKTGSCWQTLQIACAPSAQWGPADREHYVRWKEFKARALERRQKLSKEAGHSMLREKVYIVLGWYSTE